MSTPLITTINGRKCTAVANNAVGGLVSTTSISSSTTSTSTSSSTSTSTTSTSTSTSTSISTTFSTSSSPTSTQESTSIALTNINAPNPNTSTSTTQDILTSTASSTSSQSVSSIIASTSISSAIQSSAPPIPPSIPSAVLTESLSSSTTSVLDSTVASSSQTTNQGSVSITQTNGSIAPTSASGVFPSTSGSTSEVVSGGAATTTTAAPGQIQSSDAGTGLTNGAESSTSGTATSTQTTVAVAGGVIGGLALISIIAFLFWFWRKRLMKKRRSTLLTPLSTDAAYRGREKGPYIMNRTSLGPTTIPEKVRALVGYNYQRLRGRVNNLVARSPQPSVDLNRGNSQFGLPDTPASRSSSRAGATSNETMTAKSRFVDWWGRLTEDSNLNWKLRNEPKNGRPNNGAYTSMSGAMQSTRRGSQPDFLALLSREEKQQRRGSGSDNAGGSNNPRRSQSLGNDHFLGGLGLNFDTDNPFADSNVMSHDSAKVMPLAVSAGGTSNPFSDANAISGPAKPTNNSTVGGPTTYVQNIRRSRGYSTSAANARPSMATPATRMSSVYRESSISVETADTRRNRFRSDPFDLDRPELLAQSPGPDTRRAAESERDSRYSRQGNGRGLPNMPRPTHTRNESITSRYSSGVSSMGEWSEPGPDVGPGAGRWFTPSPDSSLGRQPTSGERGNGGRGKQSVGKAM